MRTTHSSGTAFEERASYSRAVRIGSHVAVSGTAPIGPDGVLHPGDTYRQTATAIEKALAAAAAGRDVNYEGAFSPVDFDKNGDIGSAVYEIWRYDGAGKIVTLRTITFRGT